jgi:ribosome biogenesis GTPase
MQGIIIGNVSNLYKIKCDNNVYEAVARGKFKKDDELTPMVGDKVEIEIIEDNNAVINKILERKNYIKRPKIANISQIIFVISTKNPKPDLYMLDKQLAYAESLGIEAVIVVNKIDLDNIICEKIKNTYEKIGYKVILTDAKDKIGIEKIKDVLKNKISAFSGNSGVGKSTIINGLFDRNITEEGEISKKNKRGKNTTTDIKLYELGENTYIADTPGFSNFDIFEIESKDLYKYFKDFNNYANNCEFVGCTHIKEEDCGIKNALNNRIN